MQINIQELLHASGIEESVYPGKKLVKACPQPGEYKSHCVVVDWRHAETLRIEVKAGLTGKDLPAKELRHYPVSFQAPTFVEIDLDDERLERSAHDEEEEGDTGRGSARGSSSGGRAMKKKKDFSLGDAMKAFSTVAEGAIANTGSLKKLVVMGKEIAKEAAGRVLELLTEQIKHMKILHTDLLVDAGKFVTKYTPPAFLQAKGDEDRVYKYDRERNSVMFGGLSPT